MHLFPDGVLRIFTTDEAQTPYRYLENQPHIMTRCPIYVWDIDTENKLTAANCRVVSDSAKEGVPCKYKNGHCNHFCKLLPHAGGKEGLVMYFACTNSLHHQTMEAKAPVTPAEITNTGIYHSTSHTTRNVHRCGSLREQSFTIELV